MYNKIASLNNIANQGLNVHKFYIPSNYIEYLNILQKLRHCTIRTDHAEKTDDLPFYIFKVRENDLADANSIWSNAKDNEYKLIIADGIKYDNIQEYNMTVMIHKNGDFVFEASELKIPLRHMYRYPLLSCYGNITEDIQEWIIINDKIGLNKLHIKKDLIDLYNYEIYDKWLEVTKYPVNVGIRNEKFVFWQIR